MRLKTNWAICGLAVLLVCQAIQVWRLSQRKTSTDRELQSVQGKALELKESLVSAEVEVGRSLAQLEALRPSSSGDIKQGQSTARVESVFKQRVSDELARDPDYQRLKKVRISSGLGTSYGLFFRKIKEANIDVDRVLDLLSERSMIEMDATRIAKDEGLIFQTKSERDAFFGRLTMEVNGQLKSVLGAEQFEMLDSYEALLPQYGFADAFARRVEYTDGPLTTQQIDGLVLLLATESDPKQDAVARENAVRTFTSTLAENQLKAFSEFREEEKARGRRFEIATRYAIARKK